MTCRAHEHTTQRACYGLAVCWLEPQIRDTHAAAQQRAQQWALHKGPQKLQRSDGDPRAPASEAQLDASPTVLVLGSPVLQLQKHCYG
jgi:hypothetical protein